MMIDLAGSWRFQLDPGDQGVEELWYEKDLGQRINLPGSLQAQGAGDDVTVDTEWTGGIVDRAYYTDARYEPYRQPGNIKLPYWLTPDKYYQGAAWYQRDVEIPADWGGRRVTLFLERPHWESRVWLDGIEIGSDISLSTPHVYELGTAVAPGSHRLTIRVDNRMIINVGPNSHSMADHTQSNWNGIIGRLELAAGSLVWIDDVQVFPNVEQKSALVRVAIGNISGWPGQVSLTLKSAAYNSDEQHKPEPLTVAVRLPRNGATVHVEYMLGEEAQLWDEFSPTLYLLTCEIEAQADQASYSDKRDIRFGLREVVVQGSQLAVNSRPIFLRGTLECCIFPHTGYPPTGVDEWRRVIRICQAHGLNHIRFHSWCPPEAAFDAADELGFYYQVECSSWANQGASIGDGDALDRWLYAEGERIVTAYGNHPSFLLMAYGNEPGGRFAEYLATWNKYWRGRDPRRVHTGGAGWPIIPENGFHNTPLPRIQAWGQELDSRINANPPETRSDYAEWVRQLQKPIVSHEIGQWCVHPDFDEIEKYTGVLKAKNFEIFRDFLIQNHMGDQARDFLMASGKLQVLCYKEDIESALRTPGFAGFQLLDLHDFPGQGTALVGVLDPFWDNKPYLSPDEFRRFCHSTVPLARMDKRYWRKSEIFSATIDVAHFGPEPLAEAQLSWFIQDENGAVVTSGKLGPFTIPTGTASSCGDIHIALAGFATAQKYKLVIEVEGTSAVNDWDIWVFSGTLETSVPRDLHVTDTLDQAELAYLAEGGKVLLLPPADRIRVESKIGFSSVFWNTAWTRGQAPHTLGILCDPAHTVFGHFPTAYHSDWQWWELIHGSEAMVLDNMPPELRPLVQPIDTWFEARRLGLMFEAKVNGGSLLVCSMDLRTNLEERLVARQLWHSLIAYLDSPDFAPEVALEVENINSLWR